MYLSHHASHVIDGYFVDNFICSFVFSTHTLYILLRLTGDKIDRDGISVFVLTILLAIKKSWKTKDKQN